MPENLMNSDHKSTNENYRNGWDRIWGGEPTVAEGNRCADGLWPHCKRVRVSPVTPNVEPLIEGITPTAESVVRCEPTRFSEETRRKLETMQYVKHYHVAED